MSDVLFVYATAADTDEAREIGRTLVRENLAACANIMAPHTAFYRWDGEIHETEEVGLILKTTAARLEAAVARIKAMHSYDQPAIVTLPVTGGDPGFLDWVRGQVAG